jgi:serine/threonine protein kinase
LSLAARSAPITPDRWEQIQHVLADALECPPSQRAVLIDARCAGDPLLRQEVDSLIRAHDDGGIVDRLAPLVQHPGIWGLEPTDEWAGRVVRHYRVLEPIGCGGMSVVYKARDERLGRHVALKFLWPRLSGSARARSAFAAEARAVAAVDHPNVCTIFEIDETENGHLFIAMPLYDGDTLEARLDRGRLAFHQAIPIALQIARGLGRAHDSGIVHRDVKPSNVVILPDGTVKILDFGIAQTGDATRSGTHSFAGTIAYMSPEQASGLPADRRSDIWSLGIVIHEMLTGARPFPGENGRSVRQAILEREPRLASSMYDDIPRGVDRVLLKTLAKAPCERHESMAALAADLCVLTRHDGPVAMNASSLS